MDICPFSKNRLTNTPTLKRYCIYTPELLHTYTGHQNKNVYSSVFPAVCTPHWACGLLPWRPRGSVSSGFGTAERKGKRRGRKGDVHNCIVHANLLWLE